MNGAKLLHPNRVRELMAAMQPQVTKEEAVKPSRKGKTQLAYEMTRKTGCSLAAAAKSWGVKVASIIRYAKENDLPYHVHHDVLESKAREIVESGHYTELLNIKLPHGLKQRVGYQLALKVGTSEACRILGISRRGVYYYCERYNLPTPERSERRVRV